MAFSFNEKPPVLYKLMESIVNFDRDENEKVKIVDLPKYARETIFDFDYPLTNKISREDFEIMILKKFMMRRIGFETLTAFKIQLEVKLNEIMDNYNMMFDSLDGWNLLNDGEKTIRERTGENTSSNESNSSSSTSLNARQDRRYSETPSNRLTEIENGTYLTTYNLDNNQNTGEDSSSVTSSGNSNNIEHETITRTPADKITIYKEFIEAKNNIYTMIFSDLNDLFYGLI